MGLGRLLSGAGVVARGWREEEVAQAQAREQFLQTQEKNRLEQFRKEQLAAPLPTPNMIQYDPSGQLGLANLPDYNHTAPNTYTGPQAVGAVPSAGLNMMPGPSIDRTNPAVGEAGTTPVPGAQTADTWQGHTGPSIDRLAPAAPRVGMYLHPNPPAVGRPVPPEPFTDQVKRIFGSAGRLTPEQRQAMYAGQPMPAAPAKATTATVATTGTKGATPAAAPTAIRTGADMLAAVPASAAYVERAARAETGGSANAYQQANIGGRSTAFGRYQFTAGTWKATYRSLNPNTKMTDAQIMALRSDPATQDQLMAHFTAGNANTLSKAGLPVNDASLYLAHFLGPTGATNLLKASASTPVDKVLDAKQITDNPEALKGKTVGDVVQWATKKMTGTAVAAAPSAGLAAGQSQTGPVSYIGNAAAFKRDPNMVPEAFRQLTTQYQEMSQLAEMYRRAGLGKEYTQARLALRALDDKGLYVHGMQGLQEYEATGDTRTLSAVMSRSLGAPVAFRTRSDGLVDMFVNGEVAKQGVRPDTLVDRIRAGFDSDFAAKQAAFAAMVSEETLKSNLKINEKRNEQIMVAAMEHAKGNIELIKEYIKANGGGNVKTVDMQDSVGIIAPGSNMIQIVPKSPVPTGAVDAQGNPVMDYVVRKAPIQSGGQQYALQGQQFGLQNLTGAYSTPQ